MSSGGGGLIVTRMKNSTADSWCSGGQRTIGKCKMNSKRMSNGDWGWIEYQGIDILSIVKTKLGNKTDNH